MSLVLFVIIGQFVANSTRIREHKLSCHWLGILARCWLIQVNKKRENGKSHSSRNVIPFNWITMLNLLLVGGLGVTSSLTGCEPKSNIHAPTLLLVNGTNAHLLINPHSVYNKFTLLLFPPKSILTFFCSIFLQFHVGIFIYYLFICLFVCSFIRLFIYLLL